MARSPSKIFPEMDFKTIVFGTLLLLFLSSMPARSTGLQCYECLEIHCEMPLLCESIRDAFAGTFSPNRHYIHFDPRHRCPTAPAPAYPPSDVATMMHASADSSHTHHLHSSFNTNGGSSSSSTNSMVWAPMLFNCSRSDSVCLEAPVEVVTSFDGLRGSDNMFHKNHIIASYGYLRGCASRRGLRELPERRITVTKFYGMNETHSLDRFRYMGQPPMEEDAYKITRIHYHEIHVDHGTINTTKCYTDACNHRRSVVRNSASEGRSFSGVFKLFLTVLGSAILGLLI